jgi:hypothetical protein
MKVLVTDLPATLARFLLRRWRNTDTPIILHSPLTGPHIFTQHRTFYESDIADRELLGTIVADHLILVHNTYGRPDGRAGVGNSAV